MASGLWLGSGLGAGLRLRLQLQLRLRLPLRWLRCWASYRARVRIGARARDHPNRKSNPNPNPIYMTLQKLGGTIHKLCQTVSRQWETRLYTQFQWYLWLVSVRDENHSSLNQKPIEQPARCRNRGIGKKGCS